MNKHTHIDNVEISPCFNAICLKHDICLKHNEVRQSNNGVVRFVIDRKRKNKYIFKKIGLLIAVVMLLLSAVKSNAQEDNSYFNLFGDMPILVYEVDTVSKVIIFKYRTENSISRAEVSFENNDNTYTFENIEESGALEAFGSIKFLDFFNDFDNNRRTKANKKSDHSYSATWHSTTHLPIALGMGAYNNGNRDRIANNSGNERLIDVVLKFCIDYASVNKGKHIYIIKDNIPYLFSEEDIAFLRTLKEHNGGYDKMEIKHPNHLIIFYQDDTLKYKSSDQQGVFFDTILTESSPFPDFLNIDLLYNKTTDKSTINHVFGETLEEKIDFFANVFKLSYDSILINELNNFHIIINKLFYDLVIHNISKEENAVLIFTNENDRINKFSKYETEFITIVDNKVPATEVRLEQAQSSAWKDIVIWEIKMLELIIILLLISLLMILFLLRRKIFSPKKLKAVPPKDSSNDTGYYEKLNKLLQLSKESQIPKTITIPDEFLVKIYDAVNQKLNKNNPSKIESNSTEKMERLNNLLDLKGAASLSEDIIISDSFWQIIFDIIKNIDDAKKEETKNIISEIAKIENNFKIQKPKENIINRLEDILEKSEAVIAANDKHIKEINKHKSLYSILTLDNLKEYFKETPKESAIKQLIQVVSEISKNTKAVNISEIKNKLEKITYFDKILDNFNLNNKNNNSTSMQEKMMIFFNTNSIFSNNQSFLNEFKNLVKNSNDFISIKQDLNIYLNQIKNQEFPAIIKVLEAKSLIKNNSSNNIAEIISGFELFESIKTSPNNENNKLKIKGTELLKVIENGNKFVVFSQFEPYFISVRELSNNFWYKLDNEKGEANLKNLIFFASQLQSISSAITSVFDNSTDKNIEGRDIINLAVAQYIKNNNLSPIKNYVDKDSASKILAEHGKEKPNLKIMEELLKSNINVTAFLYKYKYEYGMDQEFHKKIKKYCVDNKLINLPCVVYSFFHQPE
jgi:hypothetical protein